MNDGAGDDTTWSETPLIFPRIQGIDVCGEIIAAGADIQPGRVGELLLGGPCLCEINTKLKSFVDFPRLAVLRAQPREVDVTCHPAFDVAAQTLQIIQQQIFLTGPSVTSALTLAHRYLQV